jgi:hypothetical protein
MRPAAHKLFAGSIASYDVRVGQVSHNEGP